MKIGGRVRADFGLRLKFLWTALRRAAGEAPVCYPNCGIRYADKGYDATENLMRRI
jgi:hypothetical protein